MNSYDVIVEAVKDYWQVNYPQDVVVFFQQKYSWDGKWERCEELVECHGCDDYENMSFLSDFCEGQTEVKDVVIVPLCEVTAFYYKRKIENNKSKPIPAADVRPVVRGKWERISDNDVFGDIHCKCSACGKDWWQGPGWFRNANYCPNCGAKMEE